MLAQKRRRPRKKFDGTRVQWEAKPSAKITDKSRSQYDVFNDEDILALDNDNQVINEPAENVANVHLETLKHMTMSNKEKGPIKKNKGKQNVNPNMDWSPIAIENNPKNSIGLPVRSSDGVPKSQVLSEKA